MDDLSQLNEAIRHAEEIAREQCGKCSQDHKQLALWLSELKDLRQKHERSGRYFIYVYAHQEDEVVELVRGDLTTIMVPWSWFTISGDGTKPDFYNVQIIDGGQTIRLGNYEVSNEAILCAFDPVFLQRCINRNK